ncbi:MAG: hypothetical protein ACQES9_03090 [Myxococcota bacterium]
MKRTFILVIFILSAFMLVFSCKRDTSVESLEKSREKLCQTIKKNANQEKFALVQPPALNGVKLNYNKFDQIDFSPEINLVGGISLRALDKLGFFKILNQTIPNWFKLQMGMTLLNLNPGSDLETIQWGVKFEDSSKIPDTLQLFLTGNFDTSAIFDKVDVIKKRLTDPALVLKKDNKNKLSIKYQQEQILVSPVNTNILKMERKGSSTSGLKAKAAYKHMKKHIPDNTTFWFMGTSDPGKLGNFPKVVRGVSEKIEYYSGYINTNGKKEAEVQIRIRFKNANTAVRTKELLKLGFSKAMDKLGPRINKSFNGATEKTVVSRGPLVRVVFSLDKYQVVYLLSRLKNYLRKKRHWIRRNNSVINSPPKLGEGSEKSSDRQDSTAVIPQPGRDKPRQPVAKPVKPAGAIMKRLPANKEVKN